MDLLAYYIDQSLEILLAEGIDEIIFIERKISNKNIILKLKKINLVKSLAMKKIVLLTEHVRGEWKSLKRK